MSSRPSLRKETSTARYSESSSFDSFIKSLMSTESSPAHLGTHTCTHTPLNTLLKAMVQHCWKSTDVSRRLLKYALIKKNPELRKCTPIGLIEVIPTSHHLYSWQRMLCYLRVVSFWLQMCPIFHLFLQQYCWRAASGAPSAFMMSLD